MKLCKNDYIIFLCKKSAAQSREFVSRTWRRVARLRKEGSLLRNSGWRGVIHVYVPAGDLNSCKKMTQEGGGFGGYLIFPPKGMKIWWFLRPQIFSKQK